MLRWFTKTSGARNAVQALFAAVAIVAVQAQACAAAPTSLRASYKVYKAGIWIGTIEEQFTRSNDNYKLVSATETAGPLRLFLRDQLTVTSEGTIGAGGLKPTSYQFTRRNDQKKNISSTFDWARHQIVSHHGGETEIFDLPDGTQDRASAMYQFVFSIPRTAEVSVSMSQGKKAELYRYRKLGEPVLIVNEEAIPTLYYVREAKEGESKVHLWLGKDKFYLPVKIIFEDAHGSLEQRLVSVQAE